MHVYMHVINILYKYGRIHPLQNPFRCIYAKRGKIVSTAHVKNSILKFIKIKFNSSCYCKLRLGSKITRNGSNVNVNLCCHKNRMPTRVITLLREYVTSLMTSVGDRNVRGPKCPQKIKLF